MSLLLSIVLNFLVICDYGFCSQVPVEPAVIAISSCESGDGQTWGTIHWDAVSPTKDTGAFQFNDGTWTWLTGRDDRAMDAPQAVQLQYFYELWDDGWGWRHWNPSKPCWSQWLEITPEGQAVPKIITTGNTAGSH